MKKTILSIIMVSVVLLAASIRANADEVKKEKAVKELKVLSIGNSFSVCLSSYFKSVVESVPGCKLTWDHLTIGGCSLERHWENIVKEEADPSFRYFKKYSYKEKLKSQKWDIVSIQQASHFSWKPETFEPYAKNIVDFIKANAPQAEVVFQQTWAYRPDEPRLAKWGIDQKKMFEELTRAYGRAAQELNLRIIPVGLAVQIARDTFPGGYKPFKRTDFVYPDLPDMKCFLTGAIKWSPDKKTLSGDAFHLNDRGKYLQSCVWFAVLYDRDPCEITFVPQSITPEDAVFLRNAAKKAVQK
ncbi:MAG: DUF4886 domain-containing protein [Planctomycetia bacterium]|nr:DUF4886 domain-containing protein [Planctomycetia bacterium]